MINKTKIFYITMLFTSIFSLSFYSHSIETLGSLPAVNVESNPQGGTTYLLSFTANFAVDVVLNRFTIYSTRHDILY